MDVSCYPGRLSFCSSTRARRSTAQSAHSYVRLGNRRRTTRAGRIARSIRFSFVRDFYSMKTTRATASDFSCRGISPSFTPPPCLSPPSVIEGTNHSSPTYLISSPSFLRPLPSSVSVLLASYPRGGFFSFSTLLLHAGSAPRPPFLTAPLPLLLAFLVSGIIRRSSPLLSGRYLRCVGLSGVPPRVFPLTCFLRSTQQQKRKGGGGGPPPASNTIPAHVPFFPLDLLLNGSPSFIKTLKF